MTPEGKSFLCERKCPCSRDFLLMVLACLSRVFIVKNILLHAVHCTGGCFSYDADSFPDMS